MVSDEREWCPPLRPGKAASFASGAELGDLGSGVRQSWTNDAGNRGDGGVDVSGTGWLRGGVETSIGRTKEVPAAARRTLRRSQCQTVRRAKRKSSVKKRSGGS
jgi:hypothetical protein